MEGPHTLTRSNVDRRVSEGRNGVYKLKNSWNGPIRYVGRSDGERLASRIKNWTGHYRVFEYDYERNPTEAFKRECGLWHYHSDTLNNQEHPSRPHKRVTCPVCNYPNN